MILVLVIKCDFIEEPIDEEYEDDSYIIASNGQSYFPEEGTSVDDYLPDSIVVRATSSADVDGIAKIVDGKIQHSFRMNGNNYLNIKLPEEKSIEEALALLNNKPGIVYSEPNYILQPQFIPSDPLYSTNQWGPQLTNCPKAWDIEQGKEYVNLTVIDTGVDFHQEFRQRMVPGWDFVNDVPAAPYQSIDDNGHGTHVAGIAAAGGNDHIGVAGVAWNVGIKPLKVCGGRGCATYATSEAMRYAADNQEGKRIVINMSIGGPIYTRISQDATAYVHKKNVVFVVATGNNSKYDVNFPAGYSGIIGVGCTTAEDKLVYFSSKGQAVSVCAPGTDILSCAHNTWSGYVSFSGTSMASPFTAGYACLVVSANPYLTPAEVKEILEQTADPIEGDKPFTWTPEHGWGRINVGNGVELAYNIRKTLMPIEREVLGLEKNADIEPEMINWDTVNAVWDRIDKTNWTWKSIDSKTGKVTYKTIDRSKWTWTDKNGKTYILGEYGKSNSKRGFRYGHLKVNLSLDGSKIVDAPPGSPNVPVPRKEVLLMNSDMTTVFRAVVTSDGQSVPNEEGEGTIPAGEANFFNIPEGNYVIKSVVEGNNDIAEPISVTAGKTIEKNIVISPAEPVANYVISAFPIYNKYRPLGNKGDSEAPSALIAYLYVYEESNRVDVSQGSRICYDVGSNGNYYYWPKCNVVIPTGKRYLVQLQPIIHTNADIARLDLDVGYYGLLVSNNNTVHESYKLPDEKDGRALEFVSKFDEKKNLSKEPEATWWLDQKGDFYDVNTEKWIDLNRTAVTSPDILETNKVYTGYLSENDSDIWILDLKN